MGPSLRIGIPLTILWGSACSFLTVVIIKSVSTLIYYIDDKKEDVFSDLFLLAIAELIIALGTLSTVLVQLRIDCKHDPD